MSISSPEIITGQVLEELARGLNTSQDTPMTETWSRLRSSNEHHDQPQGDVAFGEPEDGDWDDVKAGRYDHCPNSDTFVMLYDENSRFMYYVELDQSGCAVSTEGAGSADFSPATSFMEQKTESDSVIVSETLARLVPEAGRFVPRSYQAWSQKKLQKRLLTKSDIPSFSKLCNKCESMLKNSVTFYQRGLTADDGFIFRWIEREGLNTHHMDLRYPTFSNLLETEIDEIKAEEAWGEVVKSYSRCKLTFWEDKWPAFQGLTTEVSKKRKWTFIHGLRQHKLEMRELLWYVEKPRLRTIECGEPSWSWLNLKDGVEKFTSPGRSRARDAEVTVEEPSGLLTLEKNQNHVLRISACMATLTSHTEVRSEFGSGMTVSMAVTNPLFEPTNSNRVLKGTWHPDTVPTPDGDLWAVVISKESVGLHVTFEGIVVAAEGRLGFWRRVGKMYCAIPTSARIVCPWNGEKRTIRLI
ncbi:hypothetical protein E8E13_009064 [Curvularia kusanoi]|uniref:Uncharacterized protein n=1 Tax=Curvularia kusanoi TaxID=90978 RepID=A0A9P4TLP6_CURKU|nr:hypothetical protein E8E13_009064 [Curvularia kusanoi]